MVKKQSRSYQVVTWTTRIIVLGLILPRPPYTLGTPCSLLSSWSGHKHDTVDTTDMSHLIPNMLNYGGWFVSCRISVFWGKNAKRRHAKTRQLVTFNSIHRVLLKTFTIIKRELLHVPCGTCLFVENIQIFQKHYYVTVYFIQSLKVRECAWHQ